MTEEEKIKLLSLWDEYKSWSLVKQNLPSSMKISMRDAYDVIYSINDSDRVASCGKPKQLTKFTLGYQLCGNVAACDCARQEALERRKKTNLQKYGTESPLANKEIREKRKSTMIERHGSEFALQNTDILEGMRRTNLERHGVDYITRLVNKQGIEAIAERMDEVKEVRAETNLKRYGFKYATQSDVVKERVARTFVERYGCHSSSLPENRQAARDTTLERFGVEYASQSEDMKRKCREIAITKYGVDNHRKKHIPAESLDILNNKAALLDKIQSHSLTVIAENLGVHPATIGRYCRQHGIPIPRSSHETEIATFLESLSVRFVSNDRVLIGPLELDFVIPDHNLAIEFNGLYWHSDKYQDRQYHRRKYLLSKNVGYRLLMVNEDEWLFRSDLVKLKIRNILGLSTRGLPARKLALREISSQEANHFFEYNHLQGKTGTISNTMGAFDGEELVAAMAFNYQRNTHDVELIRFCSDDKTHAGLFSKMFKKSVDAFGYDEIISFADLRYSDGGVYDKNGFSKVDEIDVDYRYIKGYSTFHKSLFTKANISKKFGLDMTNLTEREAMDGLGYNRIYDCGKLKYQWTRPNA